MILGPTPFQVPGLRAGGSLSTSVVAVLGIGALTLFAPSASAVHHRPKCDGWNTRGFFEAATVRQARDCLNGGSSPKARDGQGHTPLHLVAQHSAIPQLVWELVGAGAELGARSSRGDTPLHSVRYNNRSPGVVRALIRAGADLEARDEAGNTPLHVAARDARALSGDNQEAEPGFVIEVLLGAGADPMAQNTAGKTPWHFAVANRILRGSNAYWLLNDARFRRAGGRSGRAAPVSSEVPEPIPLTEPPEPTLRTEPPVPTAQTKPPEPTPQTEPPDKKWRSVVGVGPLFLRDDSIDYEVDDGGRLWIVNDSQRRPAVTGGLLFPTHGPLEVMLAVDFVSGPLRVVDTILLGITYRLGKNISFGVGYGLRLGKELNASFVKAADAQIARDDPTALLDRGRYDGFLLDPTETPTFNESPIIDSYNHSFFVGFFVPLLFFQGK